MPKNDQPGAVELLEEDHEKLRDLFKKFESASSDDDKEEIADQVDLELRVHSLIEEEILYPAMKDIDSEIVAESFEEHGVVEQLLDELATMDLSSDQFEAKFKVMQENVEHHMEEEEESMFPKAKKIPDYEQVGLRLIERKMQLMDELRMTDASERPEGGSEPATMKASEKSESLLEGAGEPLKEEPAKDAAKAPSRSQSRSKSSAASSRRSRRSTATAGRSRK